MENQKETAGMTATKQTKWGWGLVAVIGVMVAVTMGDSLIMAAIGTAMLAAGAYLGGYMEEIKSNTSTTAQPATGERRAA